MRRLFSILWPFAVVRQDVTMAEMKRAAWGNAPPAFRQTQPPNRYKLRILFRRGRKVA